MFELKKVSLNSAAERDFLVLPKTLYGASYMTQDVTTETTLIAGAHQLSGYFNFFACVVYKDNIPVARYALTLYPDQTLYIGFFETINDEATARFLFEQVDVFARNNDIHKIIGPVDASFWIRYRLKTNHFACRPYSAEPYNHGYYEQLFIAAGYKVTDRYVSTVYKDFLPKKRNQEFTGKYKEFKSKHYQIVGINKNNFDTVIREIYDMVMVLYSDFPVFKPVSFKDFYVLFKPMKFLSTPAFAKIAYSGGKPAGFVLTLPDYENLLNNLSIWTKFRIALKRVRARRYVMLYIGVLPEHRGLSRAMIKTTITNLYLRLSPLIGALIHEGKPTQNYASEAINDTLEYVLLAKEL